MRVFSAALGFALGAAGMLLLPLSSPAAVRPHHRSSTHAMVRRSGSTHTAHSEHVSSERFGPSMSSERATEIQTALIKQGYLSGEPTGTWDSASAAAMQKLQGDNNWQTKLVPDSRALIKLGLGPGSTPAPATASASATTVAGAELTASY